MPENDQVGVGKPPAHPAQPPGRLPAVVDHGHPEAVQVEAEGLGDTAVTFAIAGAGDGEGDGGVPETLSLDLDGLRVAMIHDSGEATGRLRRMRRRFPDADLVVFGHSHIPLDESGDGLRIFNPGSPTDRRRMPQGTIGLLTVVEGRLTQARIVPVT